MISNRPRDDHYHSVPSRLVVPGSSPSSYCKNSDHVVCRNVAGSKLPGPENLNSHRGTFSPASIRDASSPLILIACPAAFSLLSFSASILSCNSTDKHTATVFLAILTSECKS
jgi:hypothetical protein